MFTEFQQQHPGLHWLLKLYIPLNGLKDGSGGEGGEGLGAQVVFFK